jgi:hypothetical protein
VKVILDAGAFVAIERRDRRIEAMLRVLHEQRVPLWTSSAVVARVWRDGRKQALLATWSAPHEVGVVDTARHRRLYVTTAPP